MGGAAAGIALLALVAWGCGDTLLDHEADQNLLGPVCGPELLACGGACLSCSSPPNAHAVCAAGACGSECDSGYNLCGGNACVLESPASCGSSCSDCTNSVPPNAGAVCTAAHGCDFECKEGYLRSGGQCQRAAAVAAGFHHTCALIADGRVRCWGANDSGQLGDGLVSDSAIPVDVPLPGPARAIAAGYEYSCAIVGGAVYCWGDNTFGELGDGTTIERTSPVRAVGISQAIALAAGGGVLGGTSFGHTCAVLTGGAVKCWGANGSGQLGNDTTVVETAPVDVTILPAGTAVTAVACGERHTCALAAGAVYCWGANDSGQLGTGGTGPQRTPAAASIASGASLVATGQAHSCAVVGALQCWGLNSSGQVNAGTGTPGSFTAPATPDLGGLRPNAAATGRAHTCAVNTSDDPATPRCFGANDSGQLGGAGSIVGVTLLAPATASAVTAGAGHTCLLTRDGGIQCWGANDRGQLGNGGTAAVASAPTYVSGR